MLLTVLSDIFAIVIDILEFSQSLDDVDVLSRPCDDKLRAFMKTIIENLQRFQDVAPVLPFVVHALVKHIHDLIKVIGTASILVDVSAFGSKRLGLPIERHLSNLAHLCACRSPWIITGSYTEMSAKESQASALRITDHFEP